MTSTARSAMRLASSWMLMVSGIVTSREIFSRGPVRGVGACALAAPADGGERTGAPRRRRARWRRSACRGGDLADALDGVGSGAAAAARGRAAPRRGDVARRLCGLRWPRRRRTRGGAVARRRRPGRSASALPRRSAAGRPPRRVRVVSSVLVAGVFLALARPAASRSAARSASRAARRRHRWRCLALLGLVHLGIGQARARASISSDSWRRTTPRVFGAAALGRRRWPPRRGGRCSSAAGLRRRRRRGARLGACCSPGMTTRRFLRSTCTVLVRPCEKLWRTSPFDAALERACRLGALSRLVVGGFAHAFRIRPARRVLVSQGRRIAGRRRRRRPGYHETGRDRESVPANWCSPARQAAQHVSHLFGQKPNPIRRRAKAR